MTMSSTSLVPSAQFIRDLLARLKVAAPISGFDAALETGVIMIERAMRGDLAAARVAGVQFRKLLSTWPENPVVQAYVGAADALLAGAVDARNRMASLNQALARIDAALGALTRAHDAVLYRGVPASLETRFVAASVLQSLPAQFRRSAQCEALMEDILQSGLLEATPPGFCARVLLLAQRTAVAQRKAH